MADAARNQKLLTVEEFAELSLEGKVELIRMHRRTDILCGGDVLPGFECPVSRLLGEPPAK